MNRDSVSALNILRCVKSEERPKILNRIYQTGRAIINTFWYLIKWGKLFTLEKMHFMVLRLLGLGVDLKC